MNMRIAVVFAVLVAGAVFGRRAVSPGLTVGAVSHRAFFLEATKSAWRDTAPPVEQRGNRRLRPQELATWICRLRAVN